MFDDHSLMRAAELATGKVLVEV